MQFISLLIAAMKWMLINERFRFKKKKCNLFSSFEKNYQFLSGSNIVVNTSQQNRNVFISSVWFSVSLLQVCLSRTQTRVDILKLPCNCYIIIEVCSGIFGIENEVCSSYNFFISTLKRIPLHYSVLTKIFLQYLMMF